LKGADIALSKDFLSHALFNDYEKKKQSVETTSAGDDTKHHDPTTVWAQAYPLINAGDATSLVRCVSEIVNKSRLILKMGVLSDHFSSV